MADVRVAAGTAHAAAVALNATATITVGGIVQAAAEVVRAPETTLADLQALAATLQATLREAERLRASIAPSAESPGRATAIYRWTVAGSLAGLISALIALLAYVQATIAHPDPPPSVTVVVERPDAAEIERIVDERLRERDADGQRGQRYRRLTCAGQSARNSRSRASYAARFPAGVRVAAYCNTIGPWAACAASPNEAT